MHVAKNETPDGVTTNVNPRAKRSQFAGWGPGDCGFRIADCGLGGATRLARRTGNGTQTRIVRNEANLPCRVGGGHGPPYRTGIFCKTKPICRPRTGDCGLAGRDCRNEPQANRAKRSQFQCKCRDDRQLGGCQREVTRRVVAWEEGNSACLRQGGLYPQDWQQGRIDGVVWKSGLRVCLKERGGPGGPS